MCSQHIVLPTRQPGQPWYSPIGQPANSGLPRIHPPAHLPAHPPSGGFKWGAHKWGWQPRKFPKLRPPCRHNSAFSPSLAQATFNLSSLLGAPRTTPWKPKATPHSRDPPLNNNACLENIDPRAVAIRLLSIQTVAGGAAAAPQRTLPSWTASLRPRQA